MINESQITENSSETFIYFENKTGFGIDLIIKNQYGTAGLYTVICLPYPGLYYPVATRFLLTPFAPGTGLMI